MIDRMLLPVLLGLVGPLLAVGVPTSVPSPAAADVNESVTTPSAAASIAAGDRHTCALLPEGAVRCWGASRFGQLGYGDTDAIGDNELAAAAGDVPLGGTAIALTAGSNHTCALLETGTVRCWGHGGFGELGYGETDNVGDDETPASAGDVPVGGPVAAISAGASHTCALLVSGGVRCWGAGDAGRLGYGGTESVGDDEPASAGGDVNLGGTASAVTAGGFHTCALMTTGTVRCWGFGGSGALGYGDTRAVGSTEATEPADIGDVDLGAGAIVRAISAGGLHTCAVVDDALRAGGIRCWGEARDGQLGYGNTDDIGDDETPASAGNLPLARLHAVGISSGSAHTCATFSEGDVRCWGNGIDGRLGYGTTDSIGGEALGPPPAVTLGVAAAAVTTGAAHTCARLSAADLRCWGSGLDGRLGYANTGSIGDDETPAEVSQVPFVSRLDGTVERFADVRSGPGGSDPKEFAGAGPAVYFSAHDGGDREIHRNVGRRSAEVADLNPGDTRSSRPTQLTAIGDAVYFAGFDGSNIELFGVAGPAAGPRLVADISGAFDTNPTELAAAGDSLFFSGFDGRDRELWMSDGSTAGTARVKDLFEGQPSGHPLHLTTNATATVFFTAEDAAGRELWRSDGKSGGTERIGDINPGAASSSPTDLTAVGDRLMFAAVDGARGTELWTSDGTAVGTVQVVDLRPGSPGSAPTGLTRVGDVVFFAAVGPDGDGTELWRSDGTAAGTVQVADIAPGPESSAPDQLTRVGDRLFFTAEVAGDRELWVTDGSAEGTAQVKDVAPGRPSSTPLGLTVVGDDLYFSAADATHGRELWRSDGTTAGTFLVADLRPGPQSSEPRELAEANGLLHFSADDGTHGREPWRIRSVSGRPPVDEEPDPSDAPPSAVDDVATVAQDSGASPIDVLGNDIDTDGGPIRIESVTQPDHGRVSIHDAASAPEVRYEPAAGYCNHPDGEPDEFRYTLNGGSSALVAVSVTCARAGTTAPDTVITTPAPLGVSVLLAPKSSLRFSSNEPGATFECRVDGGRFAPCSSPHELGLRWGRHVFQVRARDAAGNVDPTPASRVIVSLSPS